MLDGVAGHDFTLWLASTVSLGLSNAAVGASAVIDGLKNRHVPRRPAGASGGVLWLQFWCPDTTGPAGLVASTGVRVQTP